MAIQSATLSVLAAIQNPTATQPPGMDKINTVLNWGMWAFSIACLFGFLAAGASMIHRHQTGELGGGQALGRVAWVAAGCLVGAAAAPLVNALVG